MDESRFFPPLGAPEYEILEYRDRLVNRWSSPRNRVMGRAAIAVWYAILNRQWAEYDYDAAFDGVRGAILRDMDSADVPHPVTNEIDPALEQELISLVKREWTPKVIATSKDPSIRTAAQVSNDLANYRMEQLDWPTKRTAYGMHYAVTGTGLIYTERDFSYSILKPIGAMEAVWCEGCGSKFYSSEVEEETLRAANASSPLYNLETARTVSPADSPSGVELADLQHCPNCEQPSPLLPYNVKESEYDQSDMFGRPLSVDTAKGCSSMEIPTVFEWYPQDAGFRKDPSTLRTQGLRRIRDAEWVEERYPHLIGDLEPDSIGELLYDDPVLGEWNILGNWGWMDSGILDHHFNIDTMIQQPTFRHPLGRFVVCSRTRVLEDDHLLQSATIGGKAVYAARAQVAISRYKLDFNSIYGRGMVDNEISPQNRLNGIDAQLIETRLRMGAPNLALPADMWPQDGAVQDSSWGVGKMIFLQPSVTMPEFTKPETIGGVTMPPEVYMERDRVESGMQRRMGPPAFASGNAPSGVGTSSGLQMLIDEKEKAGSLREAEAVRGAEKAWTHIQTMEWVLQTDEESYRVLGPDRTYSYKTYRGQALRGQTEVKIERGTYIAKSIVDREAVREAIADQLVDISSPVIRAKALEAYGLSADMTPEASVQVDHAERIWAAYHDHQTVRVQDDLDDPLIHAVVLGTHIEGEEGERFQEEAGWQDIQRKIAGWKDDFVQMQLMEQASIKFYGGRLTEQEAPEAYARAVAMYDEKRAIAEKQSAVQGEIQAEAAAVGASGLAPAPAPPPQPPPQPVVLPPLLQDRIKMLWLGKLEKSGWMPNGMQAGMQPVQPVPGAEPEPDPSLVPEPDMDDQLGPDPDLPPVDQAAYIDMRALVEAYRLTAFPIVPPTAPPVPAPGTGETALPGDKGAPPVGPGAPGRDQNAGPRQGQNPSAPPSRSQQGAKPEGGKR